MAFRGDWRPRNTRIAGAGLARRRYAPRSRGWSSPRRRASTSWRGVKGNKINWEMVPMAELLVERGQIPGDSPRRSPAWTR